MECFSCKCWCGVHISKYLKEEMTWATSNGLGYLSLYHYTKELKNKEVLIFNSPIIPCTYGNTCNTWFLDIKISICLIE